MVMHNIWRVNTHQRCVSADARSGNWERTADNCRCICSNVWFIYMKMHSGALNLICGGFGKTRRTNRAWRGAGGAPPQRRILFQSSADREVKGKQKQNLRKTNKQTNNRFSAHCQRQLVLSVHVMYWYHQAKHMKVEGLKLVERTCQQKHFKLSNLCSDR